MLAAPVLGVLPAHAGCSSWRSPQKVWLNEYFFGVGANNPPNFLELYTTSPAFQTQWSGSTVEVYSAPNTKKTYTFNSATATACTSSGKTWITYNVLGGLESHQALVILRASNGETIDAFVFDNKVPNSTSPWQNATNNWATDHTTGCVALDTALTNQAAAATLPSTQANMLILQNYGNKDMARTPDGGPIWDLTSNTGAGTTYTQCVSNNANLTKSVDNTTPTPGSTVTFTLSIANTGSSTLTGITLDDYLPDYTYSGSVAPTYISAIPVNSSDSVTPTTYSAVDPNPIIDGNPTNTEAAATKITWAPAAIAAGTTAKLNIKMQLPNNAVPGYFYQNIAQTIGGLTPNQIDFVDFTVGSANVGSFVISVNPATASTCTPPLMGPMVTITAMTGPNGTGTVHTSYNGMSGATSVVYLAASSANLRWYNSIGTLVTVSPVPAGSFVNGVATFYLADNTAETITVSAIDTYTYSPGYMQGSSGNITFTSGSGGLTLKDADTLVPIYGVVAGRPHRVQATVSQCGETATDKTGSYSGTIRYTAGLNHPVGATAPTISTTASCPGPIDLLTPGSDKAITLAFASGVSNFYLCTTDVGQYALNLSLTLPNPGGGTFTGSSGNFTVRPFVITASGFAVGSSLNQKGSAPADPVFTNAGTTFSGTFDAWSWGSNIDSDNNGLPDAEKTAANILAGNLLRLLRFSGTTNNAGVITFAPKLYTPAISAGGVPGEFLSPSPPTATASSGTVTLGTFEYSEVGSITIGGVVGGVDPGGIYGAINYLGMSGLHVPILSDVIGRFVPHHFELSGASIDNRSSAGCSSPSSFTYMGEPMKASFTLTAKNAGGETTKNYAGDFAKFTNSNPSTTYGINDSLGLWMVNNPIASPGTCTVLFNNATPSTTSFSCNGVPNPTGITSSTGPRVKALSSSTADDTLNLGNIKFTADVTLERANSPDGPYQTLNLGIAPQDADGVTLLSTAFNLDADNSGTSERQLLAATDVRYGRLVLQNAYGPETEDHKMPFLTQYLDNNKQWATNLQDSCTTLSKDNFSFGNYQQKLFDTEMGLSHLDDTLPLPISELTTKNGKGSLYLTKPSNGPGTPGQYVGSVDVTALIDTATPPLPWLLYEWVGADNDFNDNPSARANFGIYRGNDRIINWREIIR